MVQYQGKSSVNQFDGLHDAALPSDQASHTLGIVRDSLLDTHGSADLSRSHVDHSSGCQSADLSSSRLLKFDLLRKIPSQTGGI